MHTDASFKEFRNELYDTLTIERIYELQRKHFPGLIKLMVKTYGFTENNGRLELEGVDVLAMSNLVVTTMVGLIEYKHLGQAKRADYEALVLNQSCGFLKQIVDSMSSDASTPFSRRVYGKKMRCITLIARGLREEVNMLLRRGIKS